MIMPIILNTSPLRGIHMGHAIHVPLGIPICTSHNAMAAGHFESTSTHAEKNNLDAQYPLERTSEKQP